MAACFVLVAAHSHALPWRICGNCLLYTSGPEGGDGGGRVVAMGRPEEIVAVPGSFTGQWLKGVLPASQQRDESRSRPSVKP